MRPNGDVILMLKVRGSPQHQPGLPLIHILKTRLAGKAFPAVALMFEYDQGQPTVKEAGVIQRRLQRSPIERVCFLGNPMAQARSNDAVLPRHHPALGATAVLLDREKLSRIGSQPTPYPVGALP